MLLSTLMVASLATLALTATPSAWTTDVSIPIDAGQSAATLPTAVALPVFEEPGLMIEVLGANNTWPFQLCVKLHVASPAVAGAQEFGKTGYCTLYTFGATTAAKRALFRSSELFGAGSDASSSASSSVRAAAAAASERSIERRRALVGAWSQTQSPVAGHFLLTLVGASAATANMTVQLRLSGSTCAGANQYGPTCATPTQLVAGAAAQLVSTPAAAATLLQLQSGAGINVTTGALSVVVDKQSNATGGTIYARFSAPPTTTLFDSSAPLTAAVGATTLSVASPRSGTWFFLLQNGDNTTALVANVTLALKQCDASMFGADCSIAPAMIGAAGVVVDLGNLTQSAVAYFRFAANTTLAIAAAANDAAQHAPSLYAKLGSLPTETDFDAVDCSVASCAGVQRTLVVPTSDVWSGLAGAEWFVLVKSNDVGGVSVWNAGACANNCTIDAQGTCNVATSTCTCADGYENFDCSVSKNALERWEWALIIGGGVLVAIGIIGCIVYFIQRQQRRKGFERV